MTDRLPQREHRWGAVAHTPTPFSPVVDGDILPTAPWTALADGAARDVELLIGHTRDEFSLLALHLADAAHTGGATVWLYELSWGFGAPGASHGLDTLLMFGTAHIDTGLTEAGQDAMTQARQLSELIRSEHLSFAATGNPGWARYDPHGRATRVYDIASTVARYPEERSRTIWRDQRFGTLGLP